MPFQDYEFKTIRDAAVLTNSYVAADIIGLGGNFSIPQDDNQLQLYVDITTGSLTTVELKVEYSDDGTNYYQESFGTISGGTASISLGEYQFSADGAYKVSIPMKDKIVKVSVKGTGTVTGSSCKIGAIVGTV